MRISDLIRMGLRNLTRRKARTALTIIGMVIGTISIVVMFSIGFGMNESFRQQVLENGSMTIITIEKEAWYDDGNGNYQSTTQKMDDSLVSLLKGLDHVKSVSPKYEKSIQMYCGKYYSWMQIYAMDCSTFESFGFPVLESGSYPTPEHPQTVAIGSQALNDFYYWSGRTQKTKTVDLTKDKVTFTFNDYQVAEKKKPLKITLRDYVIMPESNDWRYNYYVYMDLNYFKDIYTQYAKTLKAEDRKKAMKSLESYEQIQVNVDNMKYVTSVQEEIEALGYRSNSEMQYIETSLETSNMLQMVLGAIGAVAMLVSAINIANTMIMSIYERTKEIGVMKVLGCLIKDIKKLFLFEAGMIGLIGGVIGIALSYIASYLINKYGATLLNSLMSIGYSEQAKVSMIPWWLPLAAALGTIAVGVISGYIPARRATKISAIEAMKSEG